MLTASEQHQPIDWGGGDEKKPRAVVLAARAALAAPVLAACDQLSVIAHPASTVGEAGGLLAEHSPDLFVVVLEGFDAADDAAGIGALVAMAEPEKSLALCPRERMLFLLDLFRRGLDHYGLSPCAPGRLEELLAARLGVEAPQLLVVLDREGRITDVNDACPAAFARHQEEMVGSPLTILLDDAEHESLPRLLASLQRRGDIEEQPCRLRRGDGRTFDAAVQDVSRRSADGSLLEARLELRDLGYYLAMKRRVALLLDTERELRALVMVRAKIQQALIGIKDVNELALLICSELHRLPGVAAAAFHNAEETGLMRVVACIARGEGDVAKTGASAQTDDLRLGAPEDTPAGAAFAGELALFEAAIEPVDSAAGRRMSRLGAERLLMVPILADSVMFDEAAEAVGCVSIFFSDPQPLPRDYLEAFAEFGTLASFGLRLIALNHENAALLSRMQAMAMSDMLTGAANRRHGNEYLDACVERAVAEGAPVSLVMVDVDKFKRINDEYGHAMGDEVLKAMTRVVSARLREGDLLVRWGGEEFLIIAPRIDADGAADLAESIRVAISETEIPGCHQVTASFGVSQIDSAGQAERALDLADQALYAAKEGGRNQVVVAED